MSGYHSITAASQSPKLGSGIHLPSIGASHQTISLLKMLMMVWLSLIVFGEIGVFNNARSCHVMKYSIPYVYTPATGNSDAGDTFSSIKSRPVSKYLYSIIADPQLTDYYSYRFAPKGSWLLPIIQYYSDIYMARAFRYSVSGSFHETINFYDPATANSDNNDNNKNEGVAASDAGNTQQQSLSAAKEMKKRNPSNRKIVFLGDIFDGGRILSENEYKDHLKRFHAIFGKSSMTSAGDMKYQTPSFNPNFRFIPGNHDIGLGKMYYSETASKLYENNFGPLNWHELDASGEILLVGIDSVALSSIDDSFLLQNNDDDDDESSISILSRAVKDAWEHVNAVASVIDEDINNAKMKNKMAGNIKLIILFSHIPLYREPNASCNLNSIVQRSGIQNSQGVSYRNLVSETVSLKILKKIRPNFIFTGDDHSWCKHEHVYITTSGQKQSSTEITVSTFSWLQGSIQPGYLLLDIDYPRSIQIPSPELRINLKACSLPNQYRIFGFYFLSWICSILLLLLSSFHDFDGDQYIYICGKYHKLPTLMTGPKAEEGLRKKFDDEDDHEGHDHKRDVEYGMHSPQKRQSSSSFSGTSNSTEIKYSSQGQNALKHFLKGSLFLTLFIVVAYIFLLMIFQESRELLNIHLFNE